MLPPKIPSVQARAWREEGVGGRNPATPERNQKEAAPAALLVESRTQQKSFLFLLGEKIGRAQNQKCRENFFVGRAGFRHGGGAGFLSSVQSRFVQSSEFPTNKTNSSPK